MSGEVSYAEFATREENLKKRYPYLFRGMDDLEIPYGWIGVLETMCVHVSAVLPERLRKHFIFTQIKEKFGTGRFYWTQIHTEDWVDLEELLDVDIYELIATYEAMAQHTCFVCGEPGRRVYGPWISALCKKHEADQADDEGDGE